MSEAELLARLVELRAENERLKAPTHIHTLTHEDRLSVRRAIIRALKTVIEVNVMFLTAPQIVYVGQMAAPKATENQIRAIMEEMIQEKTLWHNQKRGAGSAYSIGAKVE